MMSKCRFSIRVVLAVYGLFTLKSSMMIIGFVVNGDIVVSKSETHRNLETIEASDLLQYIVPPSSDDDDATTTPVSEQMCTCDDIGSVVANSESNMDDANEVDGNAGLFQKISNRIIPSFNQNSKLSRWMNGLFSIFREVPRSDHYTYDISTNTIVPMLSNYSIKVKSLAALIRRESENYTSSMVTSDIITTLFDLSAENMESVATLTDLIANEMRQHETMNYTHIGCLLGQLLTYIRDTTLPNIISITEVIYTKLGNQEMKNSYNEFIAVTSSGSNSLMEANNPLKMSSKCLSYSKNGNLTAFMTMRESENSIQTRISNIDDLAIYDGELLLVIVRLLATIIVFPLSFIVSFSAVIFSIFLVIFLIIFKRFPDFLDPFLPDDSTGWDEVGFIFILFLLIAFPIAVPIEIIRLVFYFFYVLLSPLLPNGGATTADTRNEQLLDVINILSMVLESPMESMVNTIQHLIQNGGSMDDEVELECGIKTMTCKSYALMDALPL